MKFFMGRINRTTYLLVVLTLTLIALLFRMPQAEHYFDTHQSVVTAIAVLLVPMLLWQFAAGARRLHDINMSGWLCLLLVIPGMQLFLLLMPGTKGKNKYGDSSDVQFDLTKVIWS